MLANQRMIRTLAEPQYGYFTVSQAKQCGFSDKHHAYHCRSGNWLKIQRGLYRLPDFADTPDSECMRHYLWSRNKNEQPQGVISHQSALAVHQLGEFTPEVIHLTVPLNFHKHPPAGCIIHPGSLNLSAVESHAGYLVTRPRQTLEDLREFLTAAGRWEATLARALELDLLSREEARQLGLASDLKPETATGPADDAEALAAPPDEHSESELMKERIYQMIFRRTNPRLDSRRRAQAGFTLVELLVVTAVISVLAGMLLPALEKAKEAATKIKCAGILSQMGIANEIYANTSNGLCFPTKEYPLSWFQRDDFRELLSIKSDSNVTAPYGYICSDALSAIQNRTVAGYYPLHLAYGMNYTGETWGSFVCWNLKRISVPSDRLYITDAVDWLINNAKWDNYHSETETGNQTIAYRHTNRANVLFFDGHVRLCDRTTLWVNNLIWQPYR